MAITKKQIAEYLTSGYMLVTFDPIRIQWTGRTRGGRITSESFNEGRLTYNQLSLEDAVEFIYANKQGIEIYTPDRSCQKCKTQDNPETFGILYGRVFCPRCYREVSPKILDLVKKIKRTFNDPQSKKIEDYRL